MQTKEMRGVFSYIKDETFKLSLFLVVLYGLTFAILQDPGQRQAVSSPIPGQEIASAYPEPQNDILNIPSIGVVAPLIVVNSKDPKDFIGPLKKGTTLFPSALPGQKGTAVILGHSAPLGWPRINYDWVFSDIQKLQKGDKVRITFENKEYIYAVTETVFLQKGQEIPANYLMEDDSRILLISCWPPGIDNKRIGVYAAIDNL